MNDRAWLLIVTSSALLFMVPGLNDQYQTPRLAAMAAACLPLLLRASARRSSLEVPAIALLVAWVISSALSCDPIASVFGSYLAPFDGLTAAVVYLGLLVGVSRLGTSVQDVAEAICWASIPLSAYAIAQRFVGFDPLRMGLPLPEGMRVIGTNGSPVYLGAVLAVVAAVAAASIGGRSRRLALTSLALCMPALWLTQTRGALLAAAFGIGFVLPRRMKIAAALAVLAAMVLHPRLHAVASDLGRIEIYREAMAIFKSHPILGSGPGTFELASREFITPAYIAAQRNASMVSQNAHNLVLQIMATAGLAGLAAFVLLCVAAWRATRDSGEYCRGILGAAALSFAVVACVNPVPHAAIALLAILFGAASSRIASAYCAIGHEHKGGCEVVYQKDRRAYACAAMAAVSFVLSVRVAVGDYHYAQAIRFARGKDAVRAANSMSLAARANPWEIRLIARRIDAAVALLPTLRHDDRKVVVNACLDWAAQGVAEHRNDPLAHEILGRTILVAVQLGMEQTPLEAMAAFKTAQSMAPTFPALMLRRRALARALGDAKEEAAAAEEFARVQRFAEGA